MDNVALRRNIDNIAEIVTNVNNVILNDFCLETDQWKILAESFCKKDKKLRRLEMFQLLGISEENILEIGICLKWTQEVRITSSGSLGNIYDVSIVKSLYSDRRIMASTRRNIILRERKTVGVV